MLELTKMNRAWNKSRLWRLLRKPDDPLDVPLLLQDTFWVDRHKHTHRIDKMSDHYIRNVLNFLDRKAFIIHSHYELALLKALTSLVDQHALEGPSYALIAIDNMMWDVVTEVFGDMDQGPEAWMKETPLYRALEAQLG